MRKLMITLILMLAVAGCKAQPAADRKTLHVQTPTYVVTYTVALPNGRVVYCVDNARGIWCTE